MIQDIIASVRDKSCWHQEFEAGGAFVHHCGRALSHAENALINTPTMQFDPQYTKVEVARAVGHFDSPVDALPVFDTVYGLSLQELNEHGTVFTGVNQLNSARPFHPGDALFARPKVLEPRTSSCVMGMDIVGWHTQDFNQRDELVCEFDRSSLVFLRGGNA